MSHLSHASDLVASEVPATVSVITADDLEARLATDIRDIVKLEPACPCARVRSDSARRWARRARGEAAFHIRSLWPRPAHRPATAQAPLPSFDLTAWWYVADGIIARAGVFNVTDEKSAWWGDVRGLSSTALSREVYSQPGRTVSLLLAYDF